MKDFRDVVAEVKARTDCRDLAEEFGLHRRWGNFLCVFHPDTNPSLSIRPHGYRCFACNASGDAIKLAMQLKGVGFRDALEYLAARCGMSLPAHRVGRVRRGVRPPAPSQAALPPPTRQKQELPTITPERRTAINTSLAWAARLRENPTAQGAAFEYLSRRGVSSATAIRAGLAFVPCYRFASQTLLDEFGLADLQAAGLFNAKGNLKLFKHQLLIPYWVDGEVVALQARNLNWRNKQVDGPKELTLSPVTVPFNTDVLLRFQEMIYICEGAIDTLSLLELGFAAVGVPGAKSFRAEWCELFADVEEVILALDNDEAGHEGAAVIAEHFRRIGREVRRLQLPEGIKDVNEFLMSGTV
jgi:DNA primase